MNFKPVHWFSLKQQYDMKIPKLLLSILGTIFLGSLPAFFAMNNVGSWYAELNKPFFSPPNWLFGPAWTLLFTLMGIALYRIWVKHGFKATLPYYPQLVLNMAWTFIFFGMENPGLALVEILVLIVAIVYLIISFWRKDKFAGLLLIPYISWVSFATLLNASIYFLNR